MGRDPSFRRLPESELERLSDDELIAYLRSASGAGDGQAARTVLGILVYGRMGDVERRVRMKVPAERVEEVAATAMVTAVAAAFDGTSGGEFHNWLSTIVARTIADFYRRGERRVKEAALPSEHGGDDAVWGEEPTTPDESGLIATQQIVDKLLDDLSPEHRQAVELHIFEDLDAATAASRIGGMSADNIAQIVSRFRKALRRALESDGDTQD